MRRGRVVRAQAPTPPPRRPSPGRPPWGPGGGHSRSPRGPAPRRSHPSINCVTIWAMAKPKLTRGDEIPELIESLLTELGEDPSRQGLKGTPSRVSRALRELTDGYGVSAAEIIAGAVFDQDYDEIVLVKNIPLYSLCGHHMLPVFCRCPLADL